MQNKNAMSGRVWKFGDNIDTDIIMPSQYLSLSLDEMYRHTFEPLREDFFDQVSPSDIILGGRNFGCGSSREQAPQAILRMGIKIVVAKSFARIFYRNALNIGLYAIESHDAYDQVTEGDIIEVLFDKGIIKNIKNDKEAHFLPFPDYLRGIIDVGGLVNYMKKMNSRCGVI